MIVLFVKFLLKYPDYFNFYRIIMPTPIIHVILAQKVQDEFFEKEREDTKRDYHIGTCISDIRRNANLKRSNTHLTDLKMDDVKKGPAFDIGFKLHCYIDQLRRSFFKETGIYELCPEGNHMHIVHATKIVQDKLHYDEVKNWEEIISYFDTVLQEELDFGIDKDIVEKWHLTLQRYFSKEPDFNTIEKLFKDVGYDKDVCDEINRLVCLIEENGEIVFKMKEFYSKFVSKELR